MLRSLRVRIRASILCGLLAAALLLPGAVVAKTQTAWLEFVTVYQPTDGSSTSNYVRFNINGLKKAEVRTAETFIFVRRTVNDKPVEFFVPASKLADFQPAEGMTVAKPGLIEFRKPGFVFMKDDKVTVRVLLDVPDSKRPVLSPNSFLFRFEDNVGRKDETHRTEATVKMSGMSFKVDPEYIATNALEPEEYGGSDVLLEIHNLSFASGITQQQFLGVDLDALLHATGADAGEDPFSLTSSLATIPGSQTSKTFDNPFDEPGPGFFAAAFGQIFDPDSDRPVAAFRQGVQVVPEPGAWALTLTGLGLLAAMRRRRTARFQTVDATQADAPVARGSRRGPAGLALLVLLGCAPFVRADPVLLPQLPDFYQHQKSGAGWNVSKDSDITSKAEAPFPGSLLPDGTIAPGGKVPSYDFTPNWWEDGGWCCLESMVDLFYYVEKGLGYDGFFTRANEPANVTWLQRMIYATEDLARRQQGLRTQAEIDGKIQVLQRIPAYVRSLEQQSREKMRAAGLAPAAPLRYSEYFTFDDKVTRFDFDDTGDETRSVELDLSARYPTLFDALRAELCSGAAVQIGLAGPLDQTIWWATGFHFVAAAGVDDCSGNGTRGLWLADPDKRNEFKDGAYTNLDVREPYPQREDLPLPIGLRFYESVLMKGDVVVDTDPDPDRFSPYAGARITQLRVIVPATEPSSAALFAAGIVAACIRRRRRSFPGRPTAISALSRVLPGSHQVK